MSESGLERSEQVLRHIVERQICLHAGLLGFGFGPVPPIQSRLAISPDLPLEQRLKTDKRCRAAFPDGGVRQINLWTSAVFLAQIFVVFDQREDRVIYRRAGAAGLS